MGTRGRSVTEGKQLLKDGINGGWLERWTVLVDKVAAGTWNSEIEGFYGSCNGLL